MKATAVAHPIQGLVKYHGMRDPVERLPYHDSISVCTAPSRTTTTVEFGSSDEDRFIVDGEELDGRGKERVDAVVEKVRDRATAAHADEPVRIESENSFRSNVGLGSSSSGFAAAATALVSAAGLELTHPEISTIARVGSASAARSVTGGFSLLEAGLNDEDCRSRHLETDVGDDLTIIAGLVPYHKETEAAHEEATESHMFGARNAHIHDQMVEMRDALREGDFDRVFETAEHDSLSLAATTMTGPAGWVYWQPRTLEIFTRVRELREEGIPVYFSTDTGASVYVNTREAYADRVEEAVADCGVETARWGVGGPARTVDDHLF
ncbi:phosphomevalonate decarboxylase MvaD [Saliphagus infecundisoli]|uniref:Phosphomevalonate decarboxylase MvaD n=1 Tax=Saliphagus infecundisoli TaxID=1849069 RepID=A0ABD5QEC1_9EURY|nr:phosphomevalonate decarboxylase MvaD [Saliphagus infecundisoli]